MIEPTGEMVQAFMRAASDIPVQVAGRELLNARAGLAAVLAIVERDQRARFADELEEHAAELWRTRRGEVGIEYVNGVEAAAHRLRSGGRS